MSTSWYAKIDANFHSNRKARKARRLGREVFVYVLCQNAARGATGSIPIGDVELWHLAEQLQMTEDEAKEGVRLAIDAELIKVAKDRVVVCGWNEEWGKRPMSDAERQQKRRDKLGGRVTNHDANVTNHDANVTNHGSRDASHRKEGIKEGRKEGREREPRAVARPLPSDFRPGSEATQIASGRQLNLEHELAQFRDWAASTGRKSRDWDAELRKWLRESKGLGSVGASASTGVVTNHGPVVTYQRTTLNPLHFHEVVDGDVKRLVMRGPDGSWQEVEAAA